MSLFDAVKKYEDAKKAVEFLNRTVDMLKAHATSAGQTFMRDFQELELARHIEDFLKEHGLRKDTED